MFIHPPKLPCRGAQEKFYQYIHLESNKSNLDIKWKCVTHLQRNLELYKSKHEKLFFLLNERDSIRELVHLWMKIAVKELPLKEDWEPTNRTQIAWEHLTAYCEEICYHAAFQVWKDDKSQSWEEFIFIARCLIYDHKKFKNILAKYDYKNSSLDVYLTAILIKNIKDKASVCKFYKWRLFLHKSDKELKEALQRSGRCELEITRFLFAKKYFKQVYQMNKLQNPTQAKGQKYPEPDNNDFQEVVSFYNTEKSLTSAPHEVASSGFITVEQLESWIETCINALQNYPKSIISRVSLELLQEAGCEVESLVDEESKLDLLENFEEISITTKTDIALKQCLLTFKLDQQKILLLYYGFDLNQAQIANKFQVTQGTIASRLKTIESKLLKTLSQLSQPPKWVSQYVNGWLVRNYLSPAYSNLIDIALVEAIKQLKEDEKEALRLCYGQKIDKQIVANNFNMAELEFAGFLIKIKAKLEINLIKQIDKKMNQYVKLWLSKVCKNLIKTACEDLDIILQSPPQQIEILNSILEKSLGKPLQV